MKNMPEKNQKLVYMPTNSIGAFSEKTAVIYTGERDSDGDLICTEVETGRRRFCKLYSLTTVEQNERIEARLKQIDAEPEPVEKICKICGQPGRFTTVAGGEICDDCM